MSILDLFKKKKEAYARAAVIGLDGVPCRMIKSLAAQGVMPVMAKLLEDGYACKMDSSMPPVSSVAWTSFMTGMNPAKHNIFGFMDRRRESYSIYFPNATQIKAPTLWDILTDAGKKTVAVNIPQTYPARETNGVIISGFVALDLEKAVYPHKLVEALQKMDYRIDVDYQNADERKEEFFKDLFYTLKKRRDTFLYLLGKVPWDLFIGVFTGTDRLQHYFWDDYENTDSPWHQTVLDYYRAIDTVIGEMTEKMSGDTALLMLSDHGFAHLEKEVFINSWLKKQGYLQLKNDAARSFEDMDVEATRAFALDPARIYINLKGVMPRGIVSPGLEYEQLVKELSDGFLALRDEEAGQQLIARVFRKEDIYTGPFIDKAPDLVLWGAQGYDLKGAVSKTSLLGKGRFTGMHTHEDAFFYLKGLAPLKVKPHIQDLAPTILQLLGMPIPPDMDGRPLV
jgi:predicted AlkP superfamily phosphohydrolase/phosphomutase